MTPVVVGRERDLLRDRFGSSATLVISRTWLAWCLAELGEFPEAIARGEEAVRIAEAMDQPERRLTASLTLGVPWLRQGDLQRAVPLLQRGLMLARDWNLQIW